MSKIPERLQKNKLTDYLASKGIEMIGQGKVRNTFRVDEKSLLVVASDRISIFDFVLNAEIPRKGEVLTALTHFWGNTLDAFFTHLRKSDIEPLYNAAYDFRRLKGIAIPLERCLIVYDLSNELDGYELIFRAHIGGSVYSVYIKTGIVAGQAITPDLPEWSKLEKPVFTPSTKAESGHDINVDADVYFEAYGDTGQGFIKTLQDFYAAAYEYAEKQGILILDTKFEGSSRLGLIGDEFLTPDSSRFCDAEDWKQAMATPGVKPKFMDKQFVREWGMKIQTPFGVTGINKLDPENLEHLDFVHSLEVPADVIKTTTGKYLEIFFRLTNMTLDDYQREMMGV
ncbi:MAG: hypothetical protein NTX66_01565 [Candidatus Falkowbacteria bacterium]|nr:hypothetical protein [Candidatus Falkowbacteria bacterium]